MSAQPMERTASGSWCPDPTRQRQADFTLEDVLNLPADAPRVELVNGVMLVVPSSAEDHQNIASLVWLWLRTHAPDGLLAVQAVGVALSVDHTMEPDVLLRRAGGDGKRHFFAADQVVLVVEVVSPHTRARDRLSKPAEYAAAGIPFYWRIEQDPIHVFAYRLHASGVYELAADATASLELDEPFPIRLPVAEITP